MIAPKRLTSAMTPAAMLVAVLALLVAGGGIGYTAAKIGTSDLKDNAVTSRKIKNGNVRTGDLGPDAVNGAKVRDFSLSPNDLVRDARFTPAALRNGVEGDCLWKDFGSQIGAGPVGYRRDRFGTVHLTGHVSAEDGAAGDADCGGVDGAEEVEDLIAFTLPPALRPEVDIFRPIRLFGGTAATLLVGGPGGLTIEGLTIPDGAVAFGGVDQAGLGFTLDNQTFVARSANLYPRQPAQELSPAARRLVKEALGLD